MQIMIENMFYKNITSNKTNFLFENNPLHNYYGKGYKMNGSMVS